MPLTLDKTVQQTLMKSTLPMITTVLVIGIYHWEIQLKMLGNEQMKNF